MKKDTAKDILAFPASVQISKVEDDCVLTFCQDKGAKSVVLSYEAAFELAIQLSMFIQKFDEEDAGDSEGPAVETRRLELVVH